METFDQARYPRLAAYLSSLPNGLDSYPHCMEKVEFVRELIDSRPIHDLPAGALPEPLQQLFRPGKAQADEYSWMPAAHFMAAIHAFADHYGLTEDDLSARVSRASPPLLRSRLLRSLVSLASPETLLLVSRAMWGHFHRGVSFEAARQCGPASATWKLVFPPYLLDRLCLRSLEGPFTLALQLSSAQDATVRLEEFDATSGRYRAQWATDADGRADSTDHRVRPSL